MLPDVYTCYAVSYPSKRVPMMHPRRSTDIINLADNQYTSTHGQHCDAAGRVCTKFSRFAYYGYTR